MRSKRFEVLAKRPVNQGRRRTLSNPTSRKGWRFCRGFSTKRFKKF